MVMGPFDPLVGTTEFVTRLLDSGICNLNTRTRSTSDWRRLPLALAECSAKSCRSGSYCVDSLRWADRYTFSAPTRFVEVVELHTSRLVLRGLEPADFVQWSQVRLGCESWLRKWEPLPPPGAPDPSRDRAAFITRCNARERERQLGTGYANSLWYDGQFVGEINVNNVIRGAFSSGHVGYWVDEAQAGKGFIPEGLVGVFGHIFDRVGLHRLQISIIPRNSASRRVVEKLGIRAEGIAQGYLQINGRWEDHVRYAITAEEWNLRREELWASTCKSQ